MKKFSTLLLVAFLTNVSFAADFFWISGTGNWDDPLQWSSTSGGTAGATTPTVTDNVIFDDNSGLLSVNDTVYVNVDVLISTMDFSAVSNAFVFESAAPVLFEIQGSLLGNVSGVDFSGLWGEINMNAMLPGETISSSGTVWAQDFRVSGNQISLTDNFNNGTNSFFVDLGGIDFGGNTFTSYEFHSNVATTRNINILNSTLNIIGGFWEVDSSSLAWTSGASEILLGDNATIAEFHGGGLVYDTLRSQSAIDFSYFEHNQFALFEVVPSSQLKIASSDTLSSDSLLLNGTCALPTEIFALTAGVKGHIEKTGSPDLQATALMLTDIDAGSTGNYFLAKSDTLNASGWDFSTTNMYWIGDAGNWTDGNHWAFSSGGTPSGCIPNSEDSVFFDLNSFTLAGQTVTVDSIADFKSMDWIGIAGNQTMILDTNVNAFGDITFDPNLTVVRGTTTAAMLVYAQSELAANASTIDCSFLVRMEDPSDSLLIVNDLIMSDTSSIVLFSGEVYTLNNTLSLGTIKSFNNPLTGSDLRTLDVGNSVIELKARFDAADDTTLVFNAGNSHLFIGDTLNYANDLISLGLDFYDVTLNYKQIVNQQVIRGNNTFHNLTIESGSDVSLEAMATQTVSDSLILFGSCDAPISISSTDTSATANVAHLVKQNLTSDFIGENLTLQQIDASGLALTALFSTDAGGNLNWTFDVSVPVTADYTASGSFCYGDTVNLSNNSTVFSGGAAAISSVWYFNDGSTGYYLNPPTDSTYITYEADTNQHVFPDGGDYTVSLVTTNLLNQCADTMTQTIHINRAEVFLATSESDTTICSGDEVVFEASGFISGMTYEYFVNGISQNTPSINDTILTTSALNNLDFVGVLAYENGCVSDSMPTYQYVVNPLPVYNFLTSDADSLICYTDSVSFSAFQPSDSSYSYQFLINGIGVTSYIDSFNYYVNDSLNHNDTIFAVGRTVLGCYDTLSMIYSVNDLPTTSLSSSVAGNVICDGDLVTFTGSGADNYEFLVNGVSAQGPSANDTYSVSTLTATDTVTVIGINSTGCEMLAPESYYYIVSPIPTTTMTFSDLDSTICSGDLVTFSASGAPLYEFFVNGVSAQFGAASDYVTDSLNNNDLVVVLGQIGACTSPAGSVVMEVLTAPTTTLVNTDDGDNTICYGTPITFTGSGATNYEFFVDGVSVQGPSALNTYSTSSLLNGQVVQLDGESNTCIISELDNFTVLNNPNVNFFSNDLDNTICDGEAIEFVAANAGTYEFFVNGTSTQGPSPLTTLMSPAMTIGPNPVLVVGTAGNGCTDTSVVINITVNPIPTVSLVSSDANNTICAGEPVTFTGSGSDFYQFFIGSTAQGALSTTSTFSTNGLSDGQVVSVFGSSQGCTSTSNTITTTVFDVPVVSITSTDINNIYCTNELVDYTANGGTNYEFFVDGVSQGPSSAISTLNSSGFPAGTFPLSVIGESNGCIDSAEVSILINTAPVGGVSSSDLDNTICDGDVVTYTGMGGDLYQFFINGIPQGSNSPTNTFTSNGLVDTDVITTVVSSAQGCSNTASMLPITVNPTPTITLVSSDIDYTICVGENVDFSAAGGTDYEFFVNGTSQGTAGPSTVFSTANLANGDDVYVIGSSLSCPSTSSTFGFTVYDYPVVSLVNNGDSVLCVLEASDLTASGATNYQFLVNGTPVGASGPTDSFASSLLNGDIVSVIGETNGCASQSVDDFTFTVYDYPVISTTSSAGPTICLNDQVDFTASGALSYVYELNGAELQSGVLSTYGTNTLADGDIITITGYNEECPSAGDDYTFTVNSMDLELDVSLSTMICEGEPVTITATGGDEYEFFLNGTSQGLLSPTNTFSSSTLTNLDEITYTAFSATTTCTQAYSSFVMMNVLDAPSISPLSNIEFCEGDSVVLLSNASYGNQWYVDGAPISGATDTAYTAFASGAYSLETTAGGLGTLWSFGLNSNGTFGDGTNFNSAEPTVSISTELFDEISTGDDFALGVTTTGELYSWGENSGGQLGDGTYASTNAPALLSTLSDIKTVATGAQSSMAVTNTGDVYVWGINADGQLSTGTTAVINFPFLNTTLTNVDSIAAGKTHFLILKTDGTVWTVGNNDQGQLGHGDLTPLFSAAQVPGLSNIVSVGAGEYSSYAIDNNGTLMVWGSNGSGQLGLNDLTNRLSPVPSPIQNAVNVQGGANHTVFQTSSKEIYTSGGNLYGQLGTNDFLPRLVPEKINISGVEQISTGQYTTLALREDKSVFGFGNNAEGQLSTSPTTAISTPEHVERLDGVGFIESGKRASHVIYNETKTCVSTDINVNALVLPAITITANSDTLTTIAGSSYQWYFNGSIIPGATNQSYIANETGDYSVEVTFANGCSGISDPFFLSFVSIDANELVSLNVYPNPATNVLNLDFDQQFSDELVIYIFDQTGRMIRSDIRLVSGSMQIDISELETGIYQLTVELNGGLTNVRFVKSDE